MSINVHVTGNPISISRGKMVTADLDHSKKEFDKRRLMRLEQVRQQSKHIAEDVRKKVKKEKLVQLKQIEDEGKQKLKNWQNRKLLELQTQYKKALKELGSGHKEAQELGDEKELLEEQKLINQEVSTKRGHKAACKLHCRQAEEQRKKNAITDRKKIVREIENTRAAMLSNYPTVKHRSEPKKKKQRQEQTDDELNINIPDSDSDSQENSLINVEEDDEDFSSSCTCGIDDSVSSDIEDNVKKKSYLVPNNVTILCGNSKLRDTSTTDSRSFEEKPPSIPVTRSKHVPSVVTLDEPPIRSYIPPSEPTPVPNIQSIPQSSSVNTFQPTLQYVPLSNTEQVIDTRISDRIKRRGILSQRPERIIPEPVQIPEVQSSTAIRDHIHNRTCCKDCSCDCKTRNLRQIDERGTKDYRVCDTLRSQEDSRGQFNYDQDRNITLKPKDYECSSKNKIGESKTEVSESKIKSSDSKIESSEIPSKPFIKLKFPLSDSKTIDPTKYGKGIKLKTPTKTITSKKSSSKPSTIDILSDKTNDTTKPSTSKQHPVQLYDHSNRFGYEKNIPSSSFVEKIGPESLEVIVDPDIQEDWLETQKRRYKEAQIRGKQALEKAKLQKDYEDMMKRLPLLQKKERIKEIYNDKPEYHMSEERLKEKEKIKQNNLENAYTKLFPNLEPALVTLPKTTQPPEDKEGSSIDSVHSINLANWDVDYKGPQVFTPQEVQDILKAFTRQDPKDRRSKLKELLRNLKLQKEELLREISALPKDDSVDELINDLRSFDNDSDEKSKPKYKRKSPRKRSRKDNEADNSGDSSIEHSSSEIAKTGNKETVGKSPRKKAKMKQKIIILQNTSTQTTPKSSVREDIPPSAKTLPQHVKEPPPSVICTKLHIPCDCDKENKQSSDNMCHIFINLNDNEKPEVIIKSKEPTPLKTKNVDIGVQISEDSKKFQSVSTKTDNALEKSKTWKEQFSKNSISTTSTSYLSPPDFQKFKTTEKLKDYFKKPQQKELSATYFSQNRDNSIPDARLMQYVKKLLSMTRVSVENLSVSTSNVETPSQSIIEIDSNNPKDQLQDMLDSFKNRMENVVDGLRYSPDYSPVPYNTSISATSSQISPKETLKSAAVDKEPTTASTKKSRESILAQYAEITETCSKRIEALAGMIQQLREDKIRMLQVPVNISKKSTLAEKTGKDASTAYMDLPEYKTDSKESSKHSSSSLDEEEIYRRLMDIDFEFVSKMKRLHNDTKEKKEKERPQKVQPTTTPIETLIDVQHDSQDGPSVDNTNKEILNRLQRLQDPDYFSQPEDPPFISFLSDIPRLPKFEPQEENNTQQVKRPPPSKGLTAIKKLNGNVTLVPHELSTIIEADSQLSTKLPSPEMSRDSINFNQQLLVIPEIQEHVSTPNVSVPDEDKSPDISVSTKEISSKSPSTTAKDESTKSTGEAGSTLDSSSKSNISKKCKGICNKPGFGKDNKHLSSSSSDDLENIENMLKSIGMEWAIPTLHKTQEALALTSSSSSLEASRKKPGDVQPSVSGSEISLKDYLKKQVLKISSSTMLTDGSLGSFLGDSSELSGIQKASTSQDKSRQRTSTPLGSSRFNTSSKSNAVFSDSELSSIRQDRPKQTKDKKDKKK